jgi:hypothetical protein
MTFRNNASQRERAEMLKLDRRNATMHGRALTELDQLMQGRFSKPSEVVGATGAPEYPAAAAWTQDHLPPEPPLGLDVSAVEPVGEPHEVQASVRRAGAASLTTTRDDSASSVTASSGDVAGPMAGASASVLSEPQPSQPKPNVWRGPYE